MAMSFIAMGRSRNVSWSEWLKYREFAMPEQDSELAESETPANVAMDDLVNAVSGKSARSPGAARIKRKSRTPRITCVALGLGLAACVVPILLLFWFPSLALEAMFLLSVSGSICSIFSLWRSRDAHRSDSLAIAALILNLVPVMVLLLGVVKFAVDVWTHPPNQLW